MNRQDLLEQETDKKVKMNLQYFAEDPNSEEGDNPDLEGEENNSEDGSKPEGDELPKSKSELDSHTNKAIQKALENQRKEFKDKLDAEREKARADAEKYAKMTEKEKEDAEMQERLKELEERERELNNRELLTNIKSDLQDKELPDAFADSLLLLQDNEKIKEAIEEIKETWDSEIAEAKKESVRQKTPKGSTRSYAGKGKGKNKADFFNEGRKI